ncbi:helix-hairpin-helix domain-containing protein [Echinicola marina]|uniref:ComEA family DNA-binding protein n=1 Tax=Echinicola marina TaxID=2859768 RepID=UPI001CF62CD8|nr:helix-hairpin-helix domain-containing protein [Echinicola marina]UCS93575.1 helix-hairpin-helix domain-containing protein [Echinicola marina]
MKKRIFYFLKAYLGFTKRESRGFLLVVPILFVLVWIPKVLDWYSDRAAEREYEKYLEMVEARIHDFDNQDNFEQASKVKTSVSSAPDTGRWERPKQERELINKLDFSEADSSLLQIVPGIGSVLAARIVKYREQLGGMYAKSQLLEVYGLKEEVAKGIFEYFIFKPAVKSKIDINQVSVKDLAAHPYVKYGEAKVIIAYRKQHGDYQSLDDLLNIKIFTKDWLDRLLPYLSI